MPHPQLLRSKTAASTRFTVSLEYRTFRARGTPPALHKCPFRSFCNAKLQRALVLLFHWNTAPLVLAEPLQLYTNAHSAAFAQQNCSEHQNLLFYRNSTITMLAKVSLQAQKAYSAAFVQQNYSEHQNLLFYWNTAPFVLAESLQIYINASSAAFA